MKDCPYAYVHFFAHKLFEKLTYIVNVVCSSPKRHDELQEAQLKEIEHLLEIDDHYR
jgi:hypothetical protein